MKKINKKKRESIKELAEQGSSPYQIAKELKVSIPTAQKYSEMVRDPILSAVQQISSPEHVQSEQDIKKISQSIRNPSQIDAPYVSDLVSDDTPAPTGYTSELLPNDSVSEGSGSGEVINEPLSTPMATKIDSLPYGDRLKADLKKNLIPSPLQEAKENFEQENYDSKTEIAHTKTLKARSDAMEEQLRFLRLQREREKFDKETGKSNDVTFADLLELEKIRAFSNKGNPEIEVMRRELADIKTQQLLSQQASQFDSKINAVMLMVEKNKQGQDNSADSLVSEINKKVISHLADNIVIGKGEEKKEGIMDFTKTILDSKVGSGINQLMEVGAQHLSQKLSEKKDNPGQPQERIINLDEYMATLNAEQQENVKRQIAEGKPNIVLEKNPFNPEPSTQPINSADPQPLGENSFIDGYMNPQLSQDNKTKFQGTFSAFDKDPFAEDSFNINV